MSILTGPSSPSAVRLSKPRLSDWLPRRSDVPANQIHYNPASRGFLLIVEPMLDGRFTRAAPVARTAKSRPTVRASSFSGADQ